MSTDTVALTPGVLSRLERVGAKVSHALAIAGAPTRGEVTTAQFFAFWDALGETSPADVGLRLGAETQVHELDVPSLAALHSPSVQAALEKLARYKRLCGPKHMVIDVIGTEVGVHTTWHHVARPAPARLVDASLASLLVLLQRGTGRALAPRRVELSREKSEEAMLLRFFGCRVRFRAGRDALVLDRSVLGMPLVTHNADLLRSLLPSLEEKLQPLTQRSLLEQVRAAIARRMCGERPSVEKVAHELSLSPRTLQRRLTELGVSYQSLLDDVRHDAALRLLRGAELDVTEVAFLLGFEELNSFTRAFRGWEGTTPLGWRKGLARSD